MRKRSSKAHPWMSLAAAATYLALPGKVPSLRLLRRLKTIEGQMGRPIMRRHGGRTTGTRYAVTVPLLRRWCPELFADRTDLPKAITEAIDEVDERVQSLTERVQVQASVIREHSIRLAGVERRM